jgi:hypothetical protein
MTKKTHTSIANIMEEVCWRWISVNLEYLLSIGSNYDL